MSDKNKMKEIELLVNEENQDMTISAISLVSSPAIEELFVYFNSKNEIITLAKVDEEAKCLVSPALIPEKRIVRFDPDTKEEYNVFFSAETVRMCSELYLKHENNNSATYQHEKEVNGVHTVESWIKEDKKYDKSTAYGFEGLPVGTWFVKMKIENEQLWSKIKSKELRGLSIEGMFAQQLSKLSKIEKKRYSNEEILQALKDIIEGK